MNLRHEKTLYIIATKFSRNTGGLLWTSQLASYAQQKYGRTKTIDLSTEHYIVRKNRLIEMIYYLFFFLTRSNFFVFIDHRLHLRFGVPLLISALIRKTGYGTICHHVFYKIKMNPYRRTIEYLSERLFMKNARFIIVPSFATSTDLINLNVNKNRITVINPAPNVTCDDMPVKRTGKHILMVGNLEPRKGIESAIEALSLLRGYDFVLDIVGGYEGYRNYYEEMKSLIFTKGLSEKIFIHGRVHEDDIVRFYRKANIFLFPSRHEGYGIVLKEAMNFGLPIVAADIPTTKEIIADGVNGYLYRVDDIQGMAKALAQLLQSKSLQYTIGLSNFRTSRDFENWKDVAIKSFRVIAEYL